MASKKQGFFDFLEEYFKETSPPKDGIDVYHYSKEDFDNFSLDEDLVGTGVGAQVYGHGGYGARTRAFPDELKKTTGGDGYVYQFRYDVDHAEMASHQVPISIQPPRIQKPFIEVAERVWPEFNDRPFSERPYYTYPAGYLYDEIVNEFAVANNIKFKEDAQRQISNVLSNKGVKGFVYEDGVQKFKHKNNSSRAQDDFEMVVMFDDNLIRTLSKEGGYATIGAMSGAGVAGMGAIVAAREAEKNKPLVVDGMFKHDATPHPVATKKPEVVNQLPWLADVTEFNDEVFKSVRHAAGPLADVLMPYEGINDYVKVVNDYNKQPTNWDRLGLLDF